MNPLYHALFYAVMVGTSIVTGLFTGNNSEPFRMYPLEKMEEEPCVEVSLPISEEECAVWVEETEVVLYDTKSGECKTLELEEYVKRVMMAEMPSWYHEEALKAQAVAVRSFTLNSIIKGKKHPENADVCTDYSHCQAYYTRDEAVEAWGEISADTAWEKISSAVDETRGEVMTYEGEVILAMYYASGYLKTRSSEEVFGGRVEYLSSVDVPHESRETSRKSVREVSLAELFERLSLPHAKECFAVEAVWESSKCLGLKVASDGKEYFFDSAKIRNALSLKSGSFYVSLEGDNVVFTVYGYGHGVGLSQDGAEILAQNGKGYRDILKTYYTGINFSIFEKYE